MLSETIRAWTNPASKGRSMSQQPDLSAFTKLLKKWRQEQEIVLARTQQGTAKADEFYMIKSFADELEAAIKKASGSADDTSEAMGNL